MSNREEAEKILQDALTKINGLGYVVSVGVNIDGDHKSQTRPYWFRTTANFFNPGDTVCIELD